MEKIAAPAAVAAGVSKIYVSGNARRVVLAGVDYTSAGGTLDLFLGPSGSGKTTLLALLSGLLKPDTGRVSLFGQDIAALPRNKLQELRARHISFIFQNFLLLADRNILSNIMLAAKLAHVASARERALAAMNRLGITGIKDLYPEEVSHGEKQRAVIARALVTGSRLLFADEPTAALDRSQAQGVMDILRELARTQNCSVLLASHDTGLLAYADRIFKIEEGTLNVVCTNHP